MYTHKYIHAHTHKPALLHTHKYTHAHKYTNIKIVHTHKYSHVETSSKSMVKDMTSTIYSPY